MPSPFLYTPPAPPHSTLYYYTPSPISPFIPDRTLYPISPYASPFSVSTPLPPISPNTRPVPLPAPPSSDGYANWSMPPRERRLSWHGSNAPTNYLQPPPQLADYRRSSFGSYVSPAPPLYLSLWNQWLPYFPAYQWPVQPTQFLIHPYLNAESPRLDFFFDLSLPTFSPMRFISAGQSILLSSDELSQPATYPHSTSLHITCDLIPSWPIDLVYNGSTGAGPPPISLGDVLVAIHTKLHERISHMDWAVLAPEQERAVALAYSKRCKRAGNANAAERANGVKRADYLLGKVRFMGLIWVGPGCVKMYVT